MTWKLGVDRSDDLDWSINLAGNEGKRIKATMVNRLYWSVSDYYCKRTDIWGAKLIHNRLVHNSHTV